MSFILTVVTSFAISVLVVAGYHKLVWRDPDVPDDDGWA